MSQNFGTGLLRGFSAIAGAGDQFMKNRNQLEQSRLRMEQADALEMVNTAENARQLSNNFFSTGLGIESLKVSGGSSGDFMQLSSTALENSDHKIDLENYMIHNDVVSLYEGEDGNLQRAKGIKILPATSMGTNDPGLEGKYIVQIDRQDGGKGIVTNMRTSDPNDEVRIFTKEEIFGLAQDTMNMHRVQAGDDVMVGRLMGLTAEETVRQAGLQEAERIAKIKPAMAQEYLVSFMNMDYDDQVASLRDFGVDVDQLLKDQVKNTPAGQQGGVLTPYQERAAEINERLIAARNADYGGTGRPAMQKKSKALRPIKDELDMALEDYPEIAALREKQEPLKNDRAGNRERSKIDQQIKQIKADLIKGLPTVASASQPQGSISGTNGQIQLTEDSIRTALKDRLLRPSEEDYEYMRTRLADLGITKYSDAITASREGRMTSDDRVRFAAMIAAAQPTLTAGSAKAMNPIDAFNEVLYNITPRKQQLDEDQFALDRDKYFDEMREKYGEAVGNVQDNLDKQAEALFNPDDRTVKGPNDIDLRTSALVVDRVAALSQTGGNIGKANKDVFFRALTQDLAGLAQTKGAATWGDFFMQWFQKDTGFVIGGFQDRVFLRTEGGREELVFKNADLTTDQNFTIPFSDLQGHYSNKTLDILRTQIPREM